MTVETMKRKRSKDKLQSKTKKVKKPIPTEPAQVDDSDDGSVSDDMYNHSSDEEANTGAMATGSVPKAAAPLASVPSPSLPKMTKQKKSELYKPPTSEEITELNEAQLLYKSSLFSLQVKELLAEVKIGRSKREQIDAYLHKLRHILLNMKSGKEHDIKDCSWFGDKVTLPITPHSTPCKGQMKFVPPTQVKVIGSYLLGTCIKPDITADVTLTIPKGCLQAKDYLNQRYLLKRAIYLSQVASRLQKSDLVEGVSFTYHHGNHMKPILVVKPVATLGQGFTINIHTSSADAPFKLNRFSITKNNVRTQWYDLSGDSSSDVAPDEADQPATPHYNTWNLLDMTQGEHLDLLNSVIGESGGLKNGIILLKIWLHQRGLDVGRGGFSGFVLAMYVTHLVKRGKLNEMMSSYQVLRNTLLCLGGEKWTTDGVTLCSQSSDPHCPTLSDHHQMFDVVLVDNTGYVNICADMTSSTFNRVRHEAHLALQCLDSISGDSFESLFMTPVSFFNKFDLVFHLSDLENLSPLVSKNELDHRMMDRSGDVISVTLPVLVGLLEKSLGPRAKLIYVNPLTQGEWNVTSAPPKASSVDKISFGVVLDPERAFSVVEKGPHADSTEAGEFREFWGDKSELRRFQDASIREAVFWPSKTDAEKRAIPGKIIKHILNLQAGIPRDSVTVIGAQLDPLLRLPVGVRRKTVVYGTGEEQTRDVLSVYEELSKSVRSLTDLPLTVTTLHGVHPVFRHTEVFPPMPATFESETDSLGKRRVPLSNKRCPYYSHPIQVLIMLEASGKWPENIEAVQRLKAAFHIQLAKSLSRGHGLQSQVHTTHVDVFKGGYIFRLEIGYTKEISLLRIKTTDDGMTKMEENAESQALEQRLVNLPKLSSTLHGIQQLNNSFSGAVRLAKRWVASQMLLGDHIPELAVELLMAHVYTTDNTMGHTHCPQVGFSRFLTQLTKHDWNTTPLIINFNSSLSGEECSEIQSHFSSNRSSLPLMFISTPYDKLNSVWTREAPSAPILQRLVVLAKESLGVLNNMLDKTEVKLDFKKLFRPPLGIYDAVIHLSQEHNCNPHQAVDVDKDAKYTAKYGTATSGGDKEESSMPVTDYNPARLYMDELRSCYGDQALFFNDKYGGDVIGVLFKPSAKQAAKFKVTAVSALHPVALESAGEPQMMLNIPAILEDFRAIGQGLVLKIVTKKR